MTKEQAIKEFENGKTVRLTCGVWNNPLKHGRIAQSAYEIEKFYAWAYQVDEDKLVDGIIDLVGASCGDMW